MNPILAALMSTGMATTITISQTFPKDTLKVQARQLQESLLAEDWQGLLAFTHPVIINASGGREQTIRIAKDVFEKMGEAGLKLSAASLGTPSSIYQVDGELYAIVPTSSEFRIGSEVVIGTDNYFIGVSPDHGVTWKFLDGWGIKGDRQTLLRWLPAFPDELELPPRHDEPYLKSP